MTEYRNPAARVPHRGFSANTFPISERDAHLFRVPRHLFDQGWRMFERCSRPRILLFPLSILVHQKSSLELLYRGEHLDVHAGFVSLPIRTRITGEINGVWGAFCIPVCVCVARVNGVRYVLDDFEFHWCSNLMQIAELSGDNVVPRKVFARFTLASSGAFRIRGVLKKGINRGKRILLEIQYHSCFFKI